MMDEILTVFRDLNIWSRGGRRAPHKPLLILIALGRWANGNHDAIPFSVIEEQLRELLKEFGPPRASSPEEPFWRLRRDGIWEPGGTERLSSPMAPDPPGLIAMRDGVTGQFSPQVREAFTENPALVPQIARSILEAHFPESLHTDILSAVGLDLSEPVVSTPTPATRRCRDPRFRTQVMSAYGYRCAVCGLGLRLGLAPVGLEAAHLMWFQAGGPDEVNNGLSLCALHHRAFDLGAFTVEPGGQILVSADVNGEGADVLLKHHRAPVAGTTVDSDRPGKQFLEWHREEVFRGRVRS